VTTTRPGFNAAAWNGEKPLVEPMPTTYALGDIVYSVEKNDKGFSVLEGVVLWVQADEDGEPQLTIGRSVRRPQTKTYSEVRCACYRETHPASAFDHSLTKHSTPHDRFTSNRAAAEMAMAVSLSHLRGAPWSVQDRFLLAGAVQLASLGHEDVRDQ
jgi:hypothetical protein